MGAATIKEETTRRLQLWGQRDYSVVRIAKIDRIVALLSKPQHLSIYCMMRSLFLTFWITCIPVATMSGQDAPAKKGEWQSLFDGKTLKGWTKGDGGPVEAGWKVVDGTIHRSDKGGDIFTEKKYYNFELEFEWKVAKGANSGLKYRFADYFGQSIGCEYQVLDDSNHSNGANPKQTAGALYDVVAPDSAVKKLKKVGEWNQSRIIAIEGKVEHWLNGKKILEVDMESEAWEKALEKSKFRDAPTFGQKSGRIMLQDHGDEAWFRNLRIKPFN